ncbi:hypothetical protein [Gordonia sp. NPDC003950]
MAAVGIIADLVVAGVMLTLSAQYSDLQSWIHNLSATELLTSGVAIASVGVVALLLIGAGYLLVFRRDRGGLSDDSATPIARIDVGTLLLWACGPMVVLVVAGWIYQPMFASRYVLSSSVAWALLGGLAAALVWRHARGHRVRQIAVCACVAVVLVGSVIALGGLLPRAKSEDPRAAAAWITERYEPSDAILYGLTWLEPELRWYLSDAPGAPFPAGGPTDITAGPVTSLQADSPWTPPQPSLVEPDPGTGVGERLDAITRGHDRVWLVSKPGVPAGWTPVPEVGAPLAEELRQTWTLTETRGFGDVRVELFERTRG